MGHLSFGVGNSLAKEILDSAGLFAGNLSILDQRSDGAPVEAGVDVLVDLVVVPGDCHGANGTHRYHWLGCGT